MAALAVLPNSAMAAPWSWRPDGEPLEVRDAFHRTLEAELAQLAATDAQSPSSEPVIAMTEANRAFGDLLGLLAGQPDEILDVDAIPGEWPLRAVLHHQLEVERSFAANTRWAVTRDADNPIRIPEELRTAHRTSEEGTIADLLGRLRMARDDTDELVEQIVPEQFTLPTIWAGHAVDVRFRLYRFASHLIEHTIQVEKVLRAIGREPQEARQMVRATWATRNAHMRRSSAADLERLDETIVRWIAEITAEGTGTGTTRI
jgi:hypothetical protein